MRRVICFGIRRLHNRIFFERRKEVNGMKNNKWLKILGMVVPVLSFGISMLSDHVQEKQTEEMVEAKVNEAMNRIDKENCDE